MLRFFILICLFVCYQISAQVSSFPHNESFESTSPSWTGITTLTTCITNTNWNRISGTTSSSGTGPSGAHSGSYYVYTESSSPCYSNTSYKTKYMYSPLYDLSGKTSGSVSFYYHMYGANISSLSLEVSTNGGSTWSSIWSKAGQQHTSNTASWSSESVSLSNYLTSATQLRFKGVIGTSYRSDMAIDNVTIDASGSSGSPDLTVSSLSAPSSATAGNTITAACVVKNSGTATASSSTLAYYISANSTYDGSDTRLATDAVASLGVNSTNSESASLVIPSGLASGTYYILFRADYTNVVAESNESNNVGARSISITAAATCSDGIQNGDETGIDCGGSCPTTCPTGGSSVWLQNGSSIYYNSGNVGIGISNPTEKLTVNGKVLAKEYQASLSYPWPDYVFSPSYNLSTLNEIEDYIQQNGHLPNIPSAKEIEEKGSVDLGEMNVKLLEKVEELTLYIIKMDKANKELLKRIEILENNKP